MDILMAPVAYDQGLAAARSHPLDPEGSRSAPRLVQIGETADVVDLERSCLGAAVLAFLREEALDDLAANAAVDRWRAVAQDRVFLPCQRNAAEHGHEWLLVLVGEGAEGSQHERQFEMPSTCRGARSGRS